MSHTLTLPTRPRRLQKSRSTRETHAEGHDDDTVDGRDRASQRLYPGERITRLERMQDIGGCAVVLPTIEEVYAVMRRLHHNSGRLASIPATPLPNEAQSARKNARKGLSPDLPNDSRL
jgi:hypothetical protein